MSGHIRVLSSIKDLNVYYQVNYLYVLIKYLNNTYVYFMK